MLIINVPANKVMSPRTVLMLLTNVYDPDPRVRQEALALIAMGCRVRLLAWDRDSVAPASQCMEGVEVERVFLRSTHGRGATQIFFYAWLYLKMLWRGLFTSFDVVHCHDLDTLPLGFLLGKLKLKPIVYDAHESFPDMLEGSVPHAVQRGLVILENFLIRRIDLLITVGEKLRRHFAERGARRTVVVGNWKRRGDFSRTEAQNLAVRNRLGIPADRLLVVCITQLLRDRKIEELLQAANQCPNVHVIISGKGILQPLVEKAELENPRILYLGYISGTQIADYTCAGDVIYYGFDPENPNARYSAPNKLFEALAAGRPLVTGDFGEIAEVVREAECGIVLRRYSAEEIAKAFQTLENPAVRDRMASNAGQRGRGETNWEKAEQVLSAEYSRLLQTQGLHPLPETRAQASISQTVK
jgi:glycosyltransferase involved in cell wall biosynthesis